MTITDITQVKTKRGQEYDVTLDTGEVKRFPGITTGLGVMDKPALKFWSAGLERDYCIESAFTLYQITKNLNLMTREEYSATLRDRLGRGYAFNRTLKRAQNTGSTAHAAIEHWVNVKLGKTSGPGPALSDDGAYIAFESFKDWAKDADLAPCAAETRICSLEHEFAGTVDLVATVNGYPTLIDFKTSKAVYISHLMQACAYHVAFEEMGRGKLHGSLVVRLPKDLDGDCKVEVVTVPPVEEIWPGVEAALNLWKFLQTREAA